MNARRVVMASLSAAAFTSSAGAQERSCTDVLRDPPRDSLRSTFITTIVSGDAARPLPVTYAQMIVEGLRQELKLPSALVLPAYEADSILPKPPNAATEPVKQWMAVPSMSVLFGVTIDSSRIGRVRRLSGVSSPAFDSSVVSAFARLDSGGLLPPLPSEIRSGPLEISLTIARLGLRGRSEVLSNPNATSMPLFIVRSPAFPVSQPVVPLPQFAAAQPSIAAAGAQEGARVRLLVTPDSTADRRTMQVIAFSSMPYLRSVFDAVPKWRFVPLAIRGCPVAALEELQFTAGPDAH